MLMIAADRGGHSQQTAVAGEIGQMSRQPIAVQMRTKSLFPIRSKAHGDAKMFFDVEIQKPV